jgi:hypothetical protein
MKRLTMVVMSLFLVACLGSFGPSKPSEEPVNPVGAPATTPPGGASAGDAAFTPTKDKLSLLPFEVRLKRLADVAGVATSDSLLESVRKGKLDLGGHDFGANIAPDLSWNAQRMSAWVQAVMPICDNPSFKARYPNWQTGLKTFAPLAWGRASDEEDTSLLADTVSQAQMPTPESEWKASCLVLLTSAELVAQ